MKISKNNQISPFPPKREEFLSKR